MSNSRSSTYNFRLQEVERLRPTLLGLIQMTCVESTMNGSVEVMTTAACWWVRQTSSSSLGWPLTSCYLKDAVFISNLTSHQPVQGVHCKIKHELNFEYSEGAVGCSSWCPWNRKRRTCMWGPCVNLVHRELEGPQRGAGPSSSLSG